MDHLGRDFNCALSETGREPMKIFGRKIITLVDALGMQVIKDRIRESCSNQSERK